MPGGPRGLQNRRCRASGEVGSIPILSALSFSIFDFRFSIGRKVPLLKSSIQHLASSIMKGGGNMSRDQIRKLTSLSSCAG